MMLRTVTIAVFLISCCVFAPPQSTKANEAEQLRRFIESRRASRSQGAAPWLEEELVEALPPAMPSPQDGLMEANKIKALPGQPEGVDFDQYSGHVTVDEDNGRALFYYFVESPHHSSTKPLVLWLNGGPGCSSVGTGAMRELGPFRVKRDRKTLERNQYAWNNVANVLFLESPAGVGYSYSNTTAEYKHSGDRKTAADSYTFLVNWLERFPQYKNREFYITGESYAGHYIPQLASTILRHNKKAKQIVINLKGIAIGNPYVDEETNEIGKIEHIWRHALFSDHTYLQVRKECNFSSFEMSEACISARADMILEMGSYDHYNIYAPVCRNSTTFGSGLAMAVTDPCSDKYVTDYLNNPDVQKALHVDFPRSPSNWSTCSKIISWTDAPVSTVPNIKQLVEDGLRVWLYSGDIDGVVSYRATTYALKMLRLPITEKWRPWYSSEQVGGYVVAYGGLTFVTVKGAGHMVPTDQPERALTMLTSFLQGKLPPEPTLEILLSLVPHKD